MRYKREESVPAKLAEVWDGDVIFVMLVCNGNWENLSLQ